MHYCYSRFALSLQIVAGLYTKLHICLLSFSKRKYRVHNYIHYGSNSLLQHACWLEYY
jgi:hypothetical protein